MATIKDVKRRTATARRCQPTGRKKMCEARKGLKTCQEKEEEILVLLSLSCCWLQTKIFYNEQGTSMTVVPNLGTSSGSF